MIPVQPEPSVRVIITDFTYLPIPIRNFDWSAVLDGYEPGCPIGHGCTEIAAISDLLQNIEDRS